MDKFTNIESGRTPAPTVNSESLLTETTTATEMVNAVANKVQKSASPESTKFTIASWQKNLPAGQSKQLDGILKKLETSVRVTGFELARVVCTNNDNYSGRIVYAYNGISMLSLSKYDIDTMITDLFEFTKKGYRDLIKSDILSMIESQYAQRA